MSQAWVSTSRKRNSANKQGRLSRENAAQIQGEDRKFAIWAAYGVIVAVLAGGSAKRTDLRVLCKPFAQLPTEVIDNRHLRAPRQARGADTSPYAV